MNRDTRTFILGMFLLIIGSSGLYESGLSIKDETFGGFDFVFLVAQIICTVSGSIKIIKTTN